MSLEQCNWQNILSIANIAHFHFLFSAFNRDIYRKLLVFHGFKNVTAFTHTNTHPHARMRVHWQAALFSVSISCSSTGSLSPYIMLISVTALYSKDGSCTRTAGHVHLLLLYKHARAPKDAHKKNKLATSRCLKPNVWSSVPGCCQSTCQGMMDGFFWCVSCGAGVMFAGLTVRVTAGSSEIICGLDVCGGLA